MSLKGYRYMENDFQVTNDMKKDFEDNGYIIVRDLLSNDEVKHVEQALTVGKFQEHTYAVPDGAGQETHMIMWNHPGEDVTGMVARSEKVAGTCEQLLGGEVYHYHTKLMKKPPKIGGRHIWHQDYGYWYNYGCLFPNMMTVFIAVDKCTRSNSCLQILKGSHKCGRIEHVKVAGQVGADMERVNELAKSLPLEYVELDKGDALFFHCNLLHCSSANTGTDRRWALLSAYNRADNNPTIQHHHPQYVPLKKVADSTILACHNFTALEGKRFIDPIRDKRPGRVLPLHEQ